MSISNKDYNEVVQYCLVRQFLTHIDSKVATIPSTFVETTPHGADSDLTNFYSINYYDYLEENTKNQNSSNLTISKMSSMKYPKELLQTTSKDLSSLISKIKLTRHPVVDQKIDYDQKNAKEIAFDTAYDKKAFSSMLQSRSGCGIKSLNIDVFSDTGAYYRHNVTLVLTFANAHILKNPEFADLLKTPGKSGKRDVAYKLECGWNEPSGKLANVRNKTLFQNKLLLVLQLVTYQLNFSQDGSVTLTINFIGRTDDAAKDYARNCLAVNAHLRTRQNQVKDKISTLDRELTNTVAQKKTHEIAKARLEGEYKSKLEQAKKLNEQKVSNQKQLNGFSLGLTDQQDETIGVGSDKKKDQKNLDVLITRIEKQIETIEKQIQTEKESLDKEITQYFFAEVLANAQAYRGHITKKSTEKTYNLFGDFADNTFRQQFGHLFNVPNPEGSYPLDVSSSEEYIRKTIQPVISPASAESVGDEDVYHFTYFHVGDVIDIASKHFQMNMKEIGEETVEIVLGNVDVTVKMDLQKEGFVFGLQNAVDKENGFEQNIVCPLYRFPISYNFFHSWYSENVVKKNRTNYAFADFVKDFLNGCVMHTLENYTNFFNNVEETQDGLQVTMKRQFRDSTIHVEACDLPFNMNTLLPFVQAIPSSINSLIETLSLQKPKRELPMISADALEQAFADGKFVFNSNENVKPVPHVLIYADTGYVKQNGNFQGNMSNGIFHFFVGAETGIMKDCQFAPIANTHRQSVQIQSALHGDNTRFNATQRYDVNIKCKGFQYFRPGQIIYVDTTLIGFGDSMHPGDIAADYNLGGYYLIIKATHEFIGMDFETNLTAKFINNGRSV